MVMTTGLTSLTSLLYVTQIFSFAPKLVVPSLLIVLVTVDEETEQKKLFGVKFVAVQLTDEEETFSENLDQPEEGGPGVKTADKEENES